MSSRSESLHGVFGVNVMVEGEVRWEALLAETDACQRLHHLVEQDLVSSWAEVKPITALWCRNIIHACT